MPLTLLLMVTEFSALQRFRLEEESSPTPLPLTALFASAISDFCCAGKLKSPLLDTAVICSFCSSPADFARITLAPLESVNDVRFSASVSLLLISACGSASTVNDKFLPGRCKLPAFIGVLFSSARIAAGDNAFWRQLHCLPFAPKMRPGSFLTAAIFPPDFAR